ncbi:iron-hydroxamate ABC transporter substrate-binding protein [Paenibacillus sp. 7124]|uniref:Iron-hydroxamate ABC transporter substrate-binding protein n=1 Tax=Paenibacillus apii TaxID=1850370 RepID=A0A6M1PLI0_9BACL|nr:iron-hydroxamate ABC transporter substrate-binding protein [Paenibacillus apii]NGM83202.1 iron-hydroxamate ABC transporter substrate-binding protein [Paenibacillus apii]NJJ38848.1 iron-hydroxamate ABC transporter substrate-binding protein [Paenibacillus apii]
MKKLCFPVLILLALVVSACGSNAGNSGGAAASSSPSASGALASAAPESTAAAETSPASASGTITYQSQNGPVEVPAHPQRVIVLSSFAGNVMALGVNLVGVDSWSKMNPNFAEKLNNVEAVSDEDLEKIIELKPDLIIGLDNVKNVDKLKQIAPTVVYTYAKVDYLTQHLEIGKLLNKEKEAQAWVDDFKARMEKAGEEIRTKIGDKTISVTENDAKQFYVFGDHWGRGTEILYQGMKLNMPPKVKDAVAKDGWYALSLEVMPEYMGDYVIFSRSSAMDNAFQQTATYKNIPAVKNNRVYEVNAMSFYFNDPLTLDYQLSFISKSILGK